MFCTGCGARLIDQARFCHLCGAPVARVDPDPKESLPGSTRLEVLGWSLLGGTLLVSLILMFVFQWPVFILGALLPFFGWRRRRR
jgi:hypothetical protein